MFCVSERGLVGLVYVFSCLSVFVMIPCFGQTVHYVEFLCYSQSDGSGALERRSSSGTLFFIRRLLQNGALGAHPSGGQIRWKSEGAKSGLLGESKCKAQTCAGKVMVSVVCESEGMLLVEFLERCATVSSDHSASHTDEDNFLPNLRR